MTDLEKQIREAIKLAEKHGLTLAVEYLNGFIRKEQAIWHCKKSNGEKYIIKR